MGEVQKGSKSMSKSDNMRLVRRPPTDRESRLTDMAVASLRMAHDGGEGPDEFRLFICNHTGKLELLPIYHGKKETG